MPLEPAGISLQAQNFNKYIKQLDTINKTQQEVFDVNSQDVTRAFNSASRAADKYEKQLKQVETANEKINRSQQQFAQGLRGAAAGLLAFATGAVVQYGAESAKLAAQFQGQQIGLENLAASYGQSGAEIQAAIQGASRGTLSGLQAINAANQGLLLGVARTPEEFANLTDSAITLGRTLGLDATQSIEQFTSALGRQSLLILDNFGISAKQVNAEIERLAQAEFGVAANQLTEAQKQATFMQAALNIAGQAAATIGEEAGNAQAAFDRLNAQAEDLQVTFGALVQPLGAGIADALARAGRTAQQFFAFLGAGFTATGVIATGVFDEFGVALSRLGQLIKGEISFAEFNQPLREFSDILDEAGVAATDRFKEIASTISGVSFPNDEAQTFAKNLDDQAQAAEEAKINLEAYQSTLRQAEQLQLSFARAAEDTAIRQARAVEDAQRQLNRRQTKLAKDQFQDRIDLLNDQGKEFEQFQQDELESVQDAEQKLNDARQKAGTERLREQQKLHNELRQAEERFNLDRIQSQRRFDLQDRRLRAAGDILALQNLREDFSLQQQEAQENFGLQDKQRKEDAKNQAEVADEQRQEQIKQLEQELNDLRGGLDQRRAQFLAAQTEEYNALLFSQAQQRQAEQERLREQEEDRQIALQRAEEDRRLSQARQLEDLGRSFAEQEGVTIEGTTAIANQLEKVFGIDGAADNIISGFTTKTESEFQALFDNIEEIVKAAELGIEGVTQRERTTTALRRGLGTGGGFGERIGGVSEFQEGGIVPGPIGAPVPAIVHGGETILPTHQQSFAMSAPPIPSQTLNVNMSGGFNITGGEAAGEAATRQAIVEMTDAFEIVVNRLGRQI